MDLNWDLKEVSKDIRCDVLSSIAHVGVGHLGGSLSIVDVLTVLYFEAMKVDPQDPRMPGRDRFVCSKGHAGPAVYATLSRRGFFERERLFVLNDGGAGMPSHCDMHIPGVDMTAGSLGQGFSCAVGMALGSMLEDDAATVYALLGDGESQEGQIWESAMFAASRKLDNLIAFTDYNKLQSDGTVAQINDLAPLGAKWAAFGWNVIDVANGNDVDEISAAVKQAKTNRGSGKPTMVILNTVKGCGVQWIVDLGFASHSCNINEEQLKAAIAVIKGE